MLAPSDYLDVSIILMIHFSPGIPQEGRSPEALNTRNEGAVERFVYLSRLSSFLLIVLNEFMMLFSAM